MNDGVGIPPAARRVLGFSRIGIGDAVRLYGLTARAIRFYEERSLLQSQRDRLNCRYYDHEAQGQLAWITRLRGAGLSLAEIGDVLAASEETRATLMLPMLARRRRDLQAQMEALDSICEDLGESAPQFRPDDGACGRTGQG